MRCAVSKINVGKQIDFVTKVPTLLRRKRISSFILFYDAYLRLYNMRLITSCAFTF